MNSHSEAYCPHIALFKAGIRRVFHASKNNPEEVNKTYFEELETGEIAFAHPWSTWKSQWPSNNAYQVMADHATYPELQPKVCNLETALHNFQIPVEGEWLLKNGSIRQAPQASYAEMAGTAQQGTTLPMRGRGGHQDASVPDQGGRRSSATSFLSSRSEGRGNWRGGGGGGSGGDNWRTGGGNWRTKGGSGGRDLGGNWRAGGGGS